MLQSLPLRALFLADLLITYNYFSLQNVIKIDPYHFELHVYAYPFKVGVFWR